MRTLPVFALLFAAALVSQCDAVATASIDFGSEWMKIGLVKPGVPMEIVLNIESQRKTPTGVSLSKGERLFAEHAINNCVKDPVSSYRYLLPLLGQQFDSPAVRDFVSLFPLYTLRAHDTRHTVVFQTSDGTLYSVEELVAMILEYAVRLAEKYAEQPINSVVVTVPPFFTQAQRKAVLLAGQIAGINIVQLINTNTAVAINYGVFRRSEFNETSQYVLFYDMGAGSTTATVVAYNTAKKKGKSSSAQLEVLGVGFDPNLGGIHFDKRLEAHLLKLFKEKNPGLAKDPAVDGRAMAKFLKEAQRVKKILSANVETYAQIEGAFADKDFRALVTRAEFEELVADLYARLVAPIDQALAAANLTNADISQFMLVGGCTRIPRVQTALQIHLNGRELGKGINADEAAALGAAYQAAVLSKGFRVKEFLIKDLSVFPIDVEFTKTGDAEDGDAEDGNVTRTLFVPNNVIPQKKLLSFNNKKADFSFTVKYGNLSFLTENARGLVGSTHLLDVSVSGVAEALAKHKEGSAKGIKAHFRMDESGVLHFDGSDAIFDPQEEPSILDKLSSILGGETSAAAPASNEADDETKPDSDANATQADNATDTKNATVANATAANATTTKPKTVKVPLKAAVEVRDSVEAPASEIEQATSTLRQFADKEAEKAATEAAKNALEAFLYITRDKLTLDDVIAVSTEDERTGLEAQLGEASLWLEEDGFDATAAQYKSKLDGLNKTAKPIFYRRAEQADRPAAVAHLQQVLNMTAEFVARVRNASANLTEGEEWIKPAEIDALLALANETAAWLETQTAAQALKKAYEDPALKSSVVANKSSKLERELLYLFRRPKPTPKPKKVKKAGNTTTFNATASNTTTADDNSTSTDDAKAEEAKADEPKAEDTKEESAGTGEDQETTLEEDDKAEKDDHDHEEL